MVKEGAATRSEGAVDQTTSEVETYVGVGDQAVRRVSMETFPPVTNVAVAHMTGTFLIPRLAGLEHGHV